MDLSDLEAHFSEIFLYPDVIYKGDPREVKSVLLDSFLSLLGGQEVTGQSGILQTRRAPGRNSGFLPLGGLLQASPGLGWAWGNLWAPQLKV